MPMFSVCTKRIRKDVTVRMSLSLVRFNVPLDVIGHFGDESFQAINYSGTDNEKVTN